MSEFRFQSEILNNQNKYFLEGFCCGHAEIDRYVKEDAVDDNSVGEGVTYLIIDKELDKLAAYFTISSASLLYFDNKDISDKISTEELLIKGIPSIELKIFAVSKAYQDKVYEYDNKGKPIFISDVLFGSVIGDIYTIITNTLGAKMIVLYSIEEAVDFYERNEFYHLDKYTALYKEYTKGCLPMYMRLFE